jgi:hypothetical protein
MYSMNACIGSDLSGEMANSQAFFVFSSSCELSASAVDMADADVVTAEEDLPEPLPYIGKSGAGGMFQSIFAFSSRLPCISDAPLALRENLAEEEACPEMITRGEMEKELNNRLLWIRGLERRVVERSHRDRRHVWEQ